MDRYRMLMDERARLVAEAEGIFAAAEGRDLTAEESARDDAIEARLSAIKEELGREERRRERERLVAAVPSITQVRDLAVDRPWAPPGATAPMAGFGDFLLAVHKAATMRQTDPRLFQAAGQGMNEAVPSDGGFVVPKAYGDDIVLRSFGSPILSRVRKQTLTVGNAIELNVVDETSRATGSRHGGVQGYWVDEGTAPSASRPQFARQEWKPRKLAFLGYATDELLADAGLVESVMSEAFMLELRFMVENAIFRGTGAGQPKGLLNEGALISVAKESGQAADTLEKENIDKMWARGYAPSRQNMVWLINQDLEPQLDNLTMVIGTGGVPVYLPAGGLGDSPFSRLKGREVIPTEYNPTVGDQGDIMLVDLSQYLLIDKGDPQRATSMHVAFTTDEMAFRVTYRVDGHLRWRSALTPFQGSNTVGPVVVLDARA